MPQLDDAEMQELKEKYDYEPFAETEEYKKVNCDIISSWVQIMAERGMKSFDRMLDIATGAGTMVQIFFSCLPERWRKTAVMCLDQSSEALKLTQRRLENQIERLNLINSKIEDIALPDDSVDVALWGNGIHYLSEESQIDSLQRIRRILKPGGWLFFNTAFYEEARPAETLPFYRSQVKKAVEFLRDKGVKREKTQRRSEASKFLPKSYYEELVEKAGFKLEEATEFAAELHKEAWEHISAFQQYAAGALHGYPIDDASDAMRYAVAPAIQEYGNRDENGNLFVVRKWLAVSARA